jgi:predicted short-subunit dehydrogenase-like oxidoreductase (DUF2520 family)
MRERPVSIIGAGIVGTAMGKLLESRGYEIAAVAARTQTSLDRASSYLDAHATNDVAEAARLGDIIFITTSDDYVQAACEDIAARGGFTVDDFVFHTSGALPLSALGGAKHAGARVGSIHPMQAFATIDGAIDSLPGSVFGVTAEDEALMVASDIVRDLGGEVIVVKDEDKALYHAAACAVSNYLVTLFDYAESLYQVIGVPEDIARQAFMPLLKGTVDNIAKLGPAQALTGPIARGDVGTITRHLEAIDRSAPWAGPIYRELGSYTVKVAMEKGSVDEASARALLETLKRGENHG